MLDWIINKLTHASDDFILKEWVKYAYYNPRCTVEDFVRAYKMRYPGGGQSAAFVYDLVCTWLAANYTDSSRTVLEAVDLPETVERSPIKKRAVDTISATNPHNEAPIAYSGRILDFDAIEPDVGKASDKSICKVGGSSSDDIVGELAALKTHLMIVTSTGAGKSTLLKSVIHRIIETRPGAELVIVDPKSETWLGLERSGIVTYLHGEKTQAVSMASKIIDKVHKEYCHRNLQVQQACTSGKKEPEFSPLFLIIDEWYTLNARIDRANNCLGQLDDIVNLGRSLNVHLIVVSQSHLCTEVGFSTALRRNFIFCCLGAIEAEAGFSPISAAINDKNLFPADDDRRRLSSELKDAISRAGKNRVVLITKGIPTIAILPNLSGINKVKIAVPVKKSSVGEDSSSSQVDEKAAKMMYKSVMALTMTGKSHEEIISEVLGIDDYSVGQRKLKALLSLGQQRGWA